MTSPTGAGIDLMELASRVEAASGPDRKIDGEIHVMLHGKPGDSINWAFGDLVQRYTASLDAAMTLVPEGFMWRLQSWPNGVNNAILEKNAGDFGAIDARHTETFAALPALALTSAALRARASLIEEDRS